MPHDMSNADDRSSSIAASRTQIDKMLDDPFKPEDPETRKLSRWIIAILCLFVSYIGLTAYDFNVRLLDLENDDNETSTTENVPPAVPSTTTRLTISASTRSHQRCAKCHAKGHDELQCRTQDPAANRR